MRLFVKVGCLVVSLVAVAACAASSGEDEVIATSADALQNNGGYTTRTVCKACGCVATEVACDCGLSGPSPKEQECLDNGGPVKKLAPIGGGGAVQPTGGLSAAP